MKTKELIQRLQEVDPTGELDVVVTTEPIYAVEIYPAHYDGVLQQIERTPSGGICGAKYVTKGLRVEIMAQSISDWLWDYEFPVDYSELCPDHQQFFKEKHSKIRAERIMYEESTDG